MKYESPFSVRYGSEKMRRIFSEEYKFRLWRRIWVALAKAQHQAGLLTKAEFADLVRNQDDLDIGRIREIEKETGHDVVAAIREYAEKAVVGGGKIHLGATSMDIVDNADTLRTLEAIDLIEQQLSGVLSQFSGLIRTYAAVPALGYTHLQPAEPTTVGYRLAFYAQDLLIHVSYLDFLRSVMCGKGMKGAVGTAASYKTALTGTGMSVAKLEESVMADLGLKTAIVASQVSSRIYDYYVLVFLSAVAASLSKFAADLRILQSPLYGEWSEPFGEKQVGSSAMPFKKNPVSSEKICSLARFVAHLPPVALENVMHSYLERTLDDSANRRIITAEAFLATDEIIRTAGKILKGMVINRRSITRNLLTYAPFAATEAVLLKAVRSGADRQKLHEEIRRLSLQAWAAVQNDQPNPLPDLLSSSQAVGKYFSAGEINRLIDVSRYTGTASGRAEKIARLINRYLGKPGRKGVKI